MLQPAAMAIETDFGAETTTDSDYANVRYFFKVELWTKDDQRVERLLHAGNRIDAARAVFNAAIKHRPGGRYTIRQRGRVLEQWPALAEKQRDLLGARRLEVSKNQA